MRKSGILGSLRPVAVGGALALAWAGQGVAQGGCPTAADLETGGIRLLQIQPTVMADYRIEDGTLMARRIHLDDDAGRHRDLVYVHPLISPQQAWLDGQVNTLTVADDPAPLDRLDEVGTFVTEITFEFEDTPNNGSDAGQTYDFRYSVEYRGETEMQMGPCRYDVWQVEVHQDRGDLGRTFNYLYAPDLGLPLSAIEDGPDGTQTTFFHYEVIEAL